MSGEVRVSAEDYAQQHGLRVSAVEHRVRAGLLDGIEDGGTLYVVRRAAAPSLPGPPAAADAPAARRPLSEHPVLFRIAFWLGSVGFVVSLAVHVAALLGHEPVGSGLSVAIGLGVFAAFMPAVIGLQAWAELRVPSDVGRFDIQRQIRVNLRIQRDVMRRIPVGERVAMALLFAYVGVNFFLSIAALDAGSGSSYRLVTGHAMLFYGVSAVLGRRLSPTADPSE